MQIIAQFKPGVYSKNKEELKKVIRDCNYKYSGSYDIKSDDKVIMVCNWKSLASKSGMIKAYFYGSGEKVDFIINVEPKTKDIWINLFTAFGANCTDYTPPTNDEKSLKQKAEAIIDCWWTVQNQQYKGEPDYFFQKRKEREERSKKEWIEFEMNKLKLGRYL